MVRAAATFFVYARAWLSLGTFYSQRVAYGQREIYCMGVVTWAKKVCMQTARGSHYSITSIKGSTVAGCLPYLRIEQDYATMGENGTAKDRAKEFHEVLKKVRVEHSWVCSKISNRTNKLIDSLFNDECFLFHIKYVLSIVWIDYFDRIRRL